MSSFDPALNAQHVRALNKIRAMKVVTPKEAHSIWNSITGPNTTQYAMISRYWENLAKGLSPVHKNSSVKVHILHTLPDWKTIYTSFTPADLVLFDAILEKLKVDE